MHHTGKRLAADKFTPPPQPAQKPDRFHAAPGFMPARGQLADCHAHPGPALASVI